MDLLALSIIFAYNMKKYLYTFVSLITFVLFSQSVTAGDPLSRDDLKWAIIPGSSNDVLTASTAGETGTNFLDQILGFVRDSIFTLLVLIAIGMFLFIGWRLIVARWNPEEFKKALQSFIYAAVWIFLVAFAYAIVRLVAGLDI